MGQITITGIYHRKNLYVQNPFSANGVGFCVYEVRVNGNVTTDELSSSAFEIDLRQFNFKLLDPVEVVIYHKDDCRPKVLNPEVLKPWSTFEVTAMNVVQKGADHFLQWETKNEQGKLNYIAEQFMWNKWVHFQETEGTGTKEPSHYEVKVNLHSRQNKFRVKQVDFTGPRVSKAVAFMSTAPAITFKLNGNTLIFSSETMYEIYDQYGNKVRKGSGSKVDITSLASGSYYLNYDNTTGQFVNS